MDIQASVAFLYSTSVQKHLLISFSLSSALTPYLTEQLYVFSAYAREPLLGACFRHLTHPLYGDLINRLPGTPPHPPSIFSPSCFLFLLHFLSVLLRLFAHHPHCRRPGPPGPHVCSLSAQWSPCSITQLSSQSVPTVHHASVGGDRLSLKYLKNWKLEKSSHQMINGAWTGLSK